MPELNREDIIKALECCTNWNPKTACKGCPCESEFTCRNLKKDALTLIKQLTEENEKLKEKADRHLDNLKAVLDERAEAKQDVAREIFEDFTKHKVCTNEEDFRVLAELKKKYIGE